MKSICFAALLAGIAVWAAPPVASNVTFNKDVLPILQKNCQNCHRPGQVAPMSFLSYKEVRPWAKAMKSAVVTRKMPPWMADPAVSAKHPLANDRSLKQSDIDAITAWVDGGAPEGDAKDKPAPVQFADGGWLNGKPDMVFEMKPYTVPVTPKAANGLVEDSVPFVNFAVPTNLTEDMWITAVEIKPGNRAVVHHAGVDAVPAGSPLIKDMEAGIGYPQETRRVKVDAPVANLANGNAAAVTRVAQTGQNLEAVGLGGFSPGHEFYRFNSARPDAARLLPAGSWLKLQIHYTSTGNKPEVDATRIGLYFLKVPVKYRYAQMSLSDKAPTKNGIPWGESNLEVKRSYTVQQPIEAAVFIPHMHWRGKDMTYKAIYPTGESETLMRAQTFSFDWQLAYELDKPVPLPKGSKIEVTAHYDNSPSNTANPFVGENAGWGDQTWNEMFIGFVGALVPADGSVKGLFRADRAE
jgi:hypothetical protein